LRLGARLLPSACAAGHLISLVLALSFVVPFDEVNLGPLRQAISVLDRREVTEKILTTIVRLDKTKALGIPSLRNTRDLPAATAAAAGRATAAAAPAAPAPVVVAVRSHPIRR